ncbi:MAG: 2,3,4,5-tetrahydropyridine-2,6-dicarboxylate N-succinyltransferase [Gammaproteobacteria bacterium]|nr:2,3,4,5-tetrahydropyridine-2,6-dicarboxylate N-succinyltransferase [Gammaproteobacteria bacterium]
MHSFALGVGTKDSSGNWLEVFFPEPQLNPEAGAIAPALEAIGYQGGNQVVELDAIQLEALGSSSYADASHQLLSTLKDSSRPLVAVILESDEKPTTVPEAYLKLHLLSHRLVKPHGINLDGLFAVLPNVVWTSQGAIAIDELVGRQLQARLNGETLDVQSVDKFPKMTNYVVPNGIRIADTSRVRLGAYVGEGTTVMHEGFINFNAGTLGTAMIEGRISAGVVVGNNSDLGGGCSIMGTLSGGGKEIISVGEDCLIGANAGIGFPLGDRCTIEAGLYVSAGSKVTVMDSELNQVDVVKARDLANKNDLLFLRNSTTGVVECRTNKSKVELNAELHSHN